MRAAPPYSIRRHANALLCAGLLAGIAGGPALAHGSATVSTSWHAATGLPAPAEGLTAIRLADGSILALGGDAAFGTPTRLAALLPAHASSWKRLPSAPVKLDTPAVLALTRQSVMVVAPAYANGNLVQPSKALLLDPVRGTWTTLPPVPVPLLAPRLWRLGSTRVIAVGGVGGAVGAVFDLHALRWTMVSTPVRQLAGYTTVLVPREGLVLMGSVAIDRHGVPYSVRRAWLLTSHLSWRELARPPIASDGAQAVLLAGNMVLFAGGRPMADNPGAPAPPALLYDAGQNAWSIAGDTGPDHRGGLLVALGGSRALLIGGHDAQGAPTMGCLLFDGHGWNKADSLPGPWAGYAAVALNSTHVLLIGGDRPQSSTIQPVADTIEWSMDGIGVV